MADKLSLRLAAEGFLAACQLARCYVVGIIRRFSNILLMSTGFVHVLLIEMAHLSHNHIWLEGVWYFWHMQSLVWSASSLAGLLGWEDQRLGWHCFLLVWHCAMSGMHIPLVEMDSNSQISILEIKAVYYCFEVSAQATDGTDYC